MGLIDALLKQIECGVGMEADENVRAGYRPGEPWENDDGEGGYEDDDSDLLDELEDEAMFGEDDEDEDDDLDGEE